MLFWQTELIVGWQVLQQSSMYAVIWGGEKNSRVKTCHRTQVGVAAERGCSL